MTGNKKTNIELLAPAGNMEKLKTVLAYGADATYLGGKIMTMRAFGKNFEDEEIKEATEYAHKLNKKIYVTINTIPHNNELKFIPDYAMYLESLNIDGVIVADFGVFNLIKKHTNLPISISTQASNTNYESVKAWRDMGAKRVILARELSLDEIYTIRKEVEDVELEVFVHGAMCMSISGRCLLSNYMTNRDANRGACSHACRWKYHLVEETRPNEYMPVFEDDDGTYIFNSKDLCTIDILDKIMDTGVNSIKLEGRMKSIYYAAVVTKMYREAVDSYKSGKYKYNKEWQEELESISHRKYTQGFYLEKPDKNTHNYESSSYIRNYTFVAKVLEDLGNNKYKVEIRNRIESGEDVELIGIKGEMIKFKLPKMYDIKKQEEIEVANPNTIVEIKTENKLKKLEIIRKINIK